MYRNEIEGFIDSHREEMIEDICTPVSYTHLANIILQSGCIF